MPPLIIVCDWIPPAFGAVGQYEMARARAMAAAGRNVTLIGLGAEDSTERETFGGVSLTIIRIAAAPADKRSLLKRALWSLEKNNRLLAATARAAASYKHCEIKVTGSPPFLSYQVLLWRGFNKRRVIRYRITDFYPETAFAAGKARWLRPLAPLIHALRRRADHIEALSACQKQRLIQSGVAENNIAIVRDSSPVSFHGARAGVRPFGDGDFVLLYSGNLGVAHDWRTFAEAYRRHVHEGPNKVRLWLNATGVGAPALARYCEEHRLPIYASAPVPLEQLANVLLSADAHLILLGDQFWGYVFPSKTYACLDSGKPCLFIGPAESDVHTLLSADPRHSSIRNRDVDAATRALARLPVCATSAACQLGSALPVTT